MADAGPQVTILAPMTRIGLPGDATLELSGEAVDQRSHMLTGRKLQWFDGPYPLGSGAMISAGPLPPGTNRIRLVATDTLGRSASATVLVDVVPVSLPFLRLNTPTHVSRRAHRLTLTAASAIPANLTVGRLTVKLTQTANRLIVPVAPGRKPVLLKITVTANGNPTTFSARVARGS